MTDFFFSAVLFIGGLSAVYAVILFLFAMAP